MVSASLKIPHPTQPFSLNEGLPILLYYDVYLYLPHVACLNAPTWPVVVGCGWRLVVSCNRGTCW